MTHLLAYIDPGTGSFALQAAVGVVAAVSFTARNQIRALISKFRKSPQADKSLKE